MKTKLLLMACMCLVFASCKDDDSKKISSNHRKVVSILSDDGQKVDFRYDKEGRISEICYIHAAVRGLYKYNYTFSQNKLLREEYDIDSEDLYFKIAGFKFQMQLLGLDYEFVALQS